MIDTTSDRALKRMRIESFGQDLFMRSPPASRRGPDGHEKMFQIRVKAIVTPLDLRKLPYFLRFDQNGHLHMRIHR